ncbi:KAP family P-loop NTPase fold protein [Caballeronia concitans]|uniref:KAP family P-loop domain protein n=1 Tax=Caballeronia concitans TaxID=1777133 RepID=A0A658QT78_9BURK|nr:P-loop NTPase fold protein [Caballeronia concitans]KIG10925.1 KAP P-loop domain protein [Burkholderia sp. MR1]SAL18585.1 KAP family P-loop domain protein [Caballeronia concitans]
MDIHDRIDTRLGETVVVASLAIPEGDAIFLSIDAHGTPGALNQYVLEHLGLDQKSLPLSNDLTDGYFISPAGRTLLCYVVTIDGGPPARLLEDNLENCLRDSRLQSLRKLWVPLMGTGTARLSLVESFRITLQVLIRNGWADRPATSVTISTPGPEANGFDALAAAIQTLVPSSSLPDEASEPKNRWSPSLAAEAVLSIAHALGKSKNESELTTELLLFALADAAQTDAFSRIGSDRSVGAFCTAIHELAGDRYEPAWSQLFKKDWIAPQNIEGGHFARTTHNAGAILDRAAARARTSGRKQFIVDDLVRALLESPGIFVDYLRVMGIEANALLEGYEDVLTGQVLMSLHNDAASIQDRLGYATYAEAIASFLSNPSTPAPISVSVQAPWGAGKSSLMQMIRERLDPERIRDAYRLKVGQTAFGALNLGSVLKLLERKKDIGPEFLHDAYTKTVAQNEDIATPPIRHEGLFTIWFNAWKYESCEQVWSGLVDAIVSQISDRLPIVQREAFLLRLHLARIDDGIVRRKIYDRVLTIWWAQVRRALLIGVGATVSLIGLGAAKTVFPDLSPLATNISKMGYWGGIVGPVLLSAYLALRYWVTREKTYAEPAELSLAPYLTVPDYAQSVGAIHQIHADLRRVLAAAPKEAADTFTPIVIFIDDLDRCSPTKIASVVEGVSMLLASDTYRCMFVIGMDPQMIAAALEKAHAEIRERLPSYERGVPLGWRFMDKFVQLPFTIPPQANINEYLKSLGAATNFVSVDPSVPSSPPLTPDGRNSLDAGTNSLDDFADTGDSGAQQPGQEKSAVPSNDSKDVGRIIRELGRYSAGNPREIKRMVNLARLYLALRNERRRVAPFWRAPSLEQYARWIALTLRWPDMMRWLQWGADEAIWSAEDNNTALIVRRLKVLEAAAEETSKVADWAARIERELYLDEDDAVEWRKDPKLFELFQNCSQSPPGRRLSAAAEIGLW